MGVGRPWPLLTGERGHYELAAGRIRINTWSRWSVSRIRRNYCPKQIWINLTSRARC